MQPQPNTVSYTVYEVTATSGTDLQVAVLQGLVRGRITRIDVDVGHDKAAGFATWDDPLDTDFSPEKVFFGSLILFSYRTDKLAVPSSTLKLYVRQRVAQNLAATRREKLPKKERDELAEQVKTELLRRAVPTIGAWSVIWDQETGRIRLHTTSTAANDDFVARLRDALGVEVRPLNTVGVMESRLGEGELDQAYHLLPTSFLGIGEAPDTDGEV
ncbi:MAG: recombination-associated protein RdgC [Deltaproteobacteria bacterium]|nr:recombination-associated protein RdgC [Deltaproteobacteria bacterium]